MGIGLKPEMHMEDDIRPLIPVAAETQVDLQNRSEDQDLAQQNTSGRKKRRAQSSRLRLGAADQPRDQNLLGNCIALKILCIGQAMQYPPRHWLGGNTRSGDRCAPLIFVNNKPEAQ